MHDNYRIKPNFKVNLEPRMKLKCDTKNLRPAHDPAKDNVGGRKEQLITRRLKKCCIDKKIIQNGVKSPK